MATTYDVAIVGAGLSGLAAALQLHTEAPELTYVVIEASDRVGGRTLTDEDGTDLGAGYIGPGQDHVMRLVDRFGLRLVKVPTEGKTCQSIRGAVAHYTGIIPPISPLGTLDLNAAMCTVESLVETIDVDDPAKSPNAERLDAMTCEEFIQRELIPGGGTWSKDARALLSVAVKAVMCVGPSEVSALGFLWYIKIAGGTKRIFETKDGLQDSKVHGGVGRVAEHIARELEEKARVAGRKPPIWLKTAVRRLDASDPKLVTLITSTTGSTPSEAPPAQGVVRAKRVILAIPPVQQLRFEFHPPLPANRLQAMQRWPMGHIIKTFTYYETPFWRDRKLNGSGVADRGISLVCMDDTKEDGSLPCIMGFVLADQAFQWSTASQPERMARLAEHYAALFQDARALKPLRYKDKVWAEEPWVGGCYVGVPAPGALTTYASRAVLTAPLFDRVLVAGTEAAKKSLGYMDGAVESGERAARNVVLELKARGRADPLYNTLQIPNPSPQMPRTVIPFTALERALPRSRTVIISLIVLLSGVGAAIWTRRLGLIMA